MSQILVFGDSITYGAWDSEGGWVQRLRKEIDKGNLADKWYWSVHNLGISGNTSTDILHRFESETSARIQEGKTVILFAFGGNDSAYLKSKKDHWTPIPQFKKNIFDLTRRARNITDKIVFIGLCKHDEKKTNPVSWNTDCSYQNKFIETYNKTLQELCKEEKVNFIEIIDLFKEPKHLALLSEDGVHPNNQGHEAISKRVYEFLSKNKFL